MPKKKTPPTDPAQVPEGYSALPGKGLISDKFLNDKEKTTKEEMTEHLNHIIRIQKRIKAKFDAKDHWGVRLTLKGLEDAETFLEQFIEIL